MPLAIIAFKEAMARLSMNGPSTIQTASDSPNGSSWPAETDVTEVDLRLKDTSTASEGESYGQPGAAAFLLNYPNPFNWKMPTLPSSPYILHRAGDTFPLVHQVT